MSRPIRFPMAAVISIPNRPSIAPWKWKRKARTSSTSAANRPGPARPRSAPKWSWRAILPVLRRLRGRLKIPISIDTWKAAVAVAALKEGAEIINDISAGRWDQLLWPAVAQYRAGYVLMHALDRPATMQKEPVYADVTGEIVDFLGKFLARAEENGIALESIVCDPGFGFGKTMTHNLTLLRDLQAFQALRRPILVGLSRKSFLKLIGGSEPLEITNELAHVWAAARGAAIWRVHDVPAASAHGAAGRSLRAGRQHDITGMNFLHAHLSTVSGCRAFADRDFDSDHRHLLDVEAVSRHARRAGPRRLRRRPGHHVAAGRGAAV